MTIIIFLVSLVVLFCLFAYKAFELKVRKVETVSSVFSRGDEMIHIVSDKMVFTYNRYRKISHIFVFEFLPSYAYEKLSKTKDFVAKKYYNTGDEFRGRRILRSNGSVSFFLERLADDTSTDGSKV